MSLRISYLISYVSMTAIAMMLSTAQVEALEFSQHFNGAARIDGESTWIYAEGTFEIGDAEKFENYMSGQQVWKNQRIVFNSGGGSVLEGIKIGQIIRKHGFRTAVSKSVKTGDYTEVRSGDCASACVLAFAGGVERGASEGSRIGVHQMSRNYENLADGQRITVEDLKGNMSVAQFLVGLTLTHLMKMGIDPTIVPLMVGTSAEDIRWLTLEEVRSTKIAFEPSAFSPWDVEASGKGLVAYSRSEDGKKQLTLFCGSDSKMRFLLKLDGKPYSTSYLTDINAEQFDIAGVEIRSTEAKAEVKGGALTISGLWPGKSEPTEYMAVFSLFGQAIGTLSDIYSLYGFNKSKFKQSIDLAKKNCL